MLGPLNSACVGVGGKGRDPPPPRPSVCPGTVLKHTLEHTLEHGGGGPPNPPTPTQALFRGPNKQGLWEKHTLEKMRPEETELGLLMKNGEINT